MSKGIKPKNGRGPEVIAEAAKAVADLVGTVENMRKYGQQAADMIRLRTRLTSKNSVSKDGGERRDMKRIKEATVEERQRLRDKGKLSPLTNPGVSNLTRTGQLLDSVKPTDASKTTVRVGPTGTRKGEDLTNLQLAKYQEEQGRPFNHLGKTESKRIADSIRRDVKAALKKRLTTK